MSARAQGLAAFGMLVMVGCTQVPRAPTPPAPVAAVSSEVAAPIVAAAPSGPKAAAPIARSTVPRPKTPAPNRAQPSMPAPPKPAAVVVPSRPAAPALDLASLEQRLKDTKAIGVFTKLSLKNQVDDLLGRFRDFYASKGTATLAELRQRYDLLMLKVLSVLQDGDPALAAAISASREAIWAILADPRKFATL